MMGEQKSEPELFNYAVNLEKRVRSNHPLRAVKAAIDFSFVREEVAHCYGKKGKARTDGGDWRAARLPLVFGLRAG